MLNRKILTLVLGILIAPAADAQTAANVLVVANRQSAISGQIAKYYIRRRGIEPGNVCIIGTAEKEEITRDVYDREIARSVGECLKKGDLRERIYYIVTTMGVPLKVMGPGQELQSEQASVDSELTVLYSILHGKPAPLAGALRNPFFGHVDAAFRHPHFQLYLVTRLAGYDFADVQGLIDRALAAKDKGKFVIDLRGDNDTDGNIWLRQAATLLPRDRTVLDDSPKVLYDLKGVIGYASWGFNDPDRHRRTIGFQWLPGAIATEFVSTNGRTFARPPQSWTLGNWKDTATWFAGSPQDLTADFVHEGVTGVSGQVYEPYLHLCPRPNYVLPAYASGRNLAESFYLGLAALSWQNIVIGDPLCKLRQ